jgi:hypothetical protein
VIENISVSVNAEEITLTPDLEFKGSRKAIITAHTDAGESLVSNEFIILVSSREIKTDISRGKIKVGEPVKWMKNITTDNVEEVSAEIPADANNVSIVRIEESGEQTEVNPLLNLAVP